MDHPVPGLATITLLAGNHPRETARVNALVCAMELVAWLAGEPHTDRPTCACPVITGFVMKLNDSMDNANRQRLKPFLPRLVDTRDGRQLERAAIFAEYAVTEAAAEAMKAAGLPEHEQKLRACKGKPIEEMHEVASAAAADAAADAAAAAYAAANAANAADAKNKEQPVDIWAGALAALERTLNLPTA